MAMGNSAKHRFAELGFPKGRTDGCEPITGDGQHAVHRRFQLEFPVPAIGLQVDEPDVGDVDGMLAVDPDESEGLEQRCDLANRPDIDKWCARAQADLGFPPRALRKYTSSRSSTRCSLLEM
jgi:hypothetical protein